MRLQETAGNAATAGLITVARQVSASAKASRNLLIIAQQTIDELDGRQSEKVLLQAVMSATRLKELPAYTAILKAKPDATYGDYFIWLFNKLHDDYGSKITVGVMQWFADAGIDIPKQVHTYTLAPLAAVARFKSLVNRFKKLLQSGDLSKADAQRVSQLILDAQSAIRSIEGPPTRPGSQVKMAGGVAMAAGAAWRLAGALAVDDVTGVGVADDLAIPFVIVGAKVVKLDFGPAQKAVEAALREMTDLLAISAAIAVQGPRAAGQLGNVAVHLARLLVLASVGGHPPGEPPKKNKDNDNHWWTEIKASIKNFFQATKGASRKQIMRELVKAGYTEAEIAEIEATLAQAEAQMGETVGPLLPP
jgi:hypothetical protein